MKIKVITKSPIKQTGFTIKKVEYKVDTANKVVVCIITGHSKVDWTYSNFKVTANTGNYKFDYGSLMSFKGVAKCKPTDKWDEVKGMRIAESKAKSHIYSYIGRMWKDMAEKCYNASQVFLSIYDNNKFCYNREIEHIKELDK